MLREELDQNRDNDESGGSQGRGTSARGFASMNKERQREIASMGGRAAHEKGTAHEFTPEEAREAGRKGGLSRGRNAQNRSETTR